jgi:glycosyltransferase involved in cell wall biosynthesis
MRILIVNCAARPHTGGANRHVVEAVALLRQAGHEVALAHDDPGGSSLAAPLFVLPTAASDTKLCEAAGHIVDSFRPDVVQVHWLERPALVGFFAQHVPACVYLHDQSAFCSGGDRVDRDWQPCHRPHAAACLLWHYGQGCGGRNPFGNWSRWRRVKAIQTALLGSACRLQVASRFMQQGLSENGVAPDRIDILPLFAQPSRVRPETEPGLMLVACRLVRAKGVQVLLAALSGLRGANWRLVVAGTGPHELELRALASRERLTDRVRFLGELAPDGLDEWYARCAFAISPVLRPEPFGLVGPEAMVRGKAVIASRGGATEEWLVHGKTGLAVEPGDAPGLARAIRTLLENPALAQAMGAAARLAASAFTPERYLDRVLASFQSCCRSV